VTAEVIARVASEGFGLLDAPPQASQRQGHARAVSSQFMGGASPDRPRHRRRRRKILR
jgi:hypothetical protein